jgi:type IV pilus assembly protein PilM
MREGKNLVGVDIGSTGIKVCHLAESRRGLTLTRCGFAPLGPQVVVDGQVMDANVVSETLQRLFSDLKIRQRECALSVSGQSVIIRKITVPMMTDAELAEQIHWEAEQHIPFDIKDVEVDYQVLKRRADASQMDILLVAAKRDQINDYAQLARNARLKPLVCDIDVFTIQNLFERARGLPEQDVVALINVGASLSSLNVVARGVSAFTREIANGGNLITEEIQKALGLPQEQAEALKCNSALAPAGDAHRSGAQPHNLMRIIEAATDAIAAEIQRSVDFYLATSGEAEVQRVYLTGGSANLPSLAQAIERRSRVSVEVWSPLDGIVVDPATVDMTLLGARAPQLAVAMGLALRKQRELRQ